MSLRHRPEGVVVRHSTDCESRKGGSCDCRPGYQAQVFSARDQRTIRKTFRTLSDARTWRAETHGALRAGTLRAPTKATLADAAEDWLSGAEAEIIRTRSGTPYKPSALRAYEQALRTKVLPELGHLRLSAITRPAVQDLVDALVASGRSPSTVRNAILPLRAIYRRALTRADVLVNPTLGLALPAQRGRRDRIADPPEAAKLLDALSADDRAVWATALFAGLRRGEIRGLRAEDVDFEAGLVRVEQSWDDKAGPIEPKSRAGRRRVRSTASCASCKQSARSPKRRRAPTSSRSPRRRRKRRRLFPGYEGGSDHLHCACSDRCGTWYRALAPSRPSRALLLLPAPRTA